MNRVKSPKILRFPWLKIYGQNSKARREEDGGGGGGGQAALRNLKPGGTMRRPRRKRGLIKTDIFNKSSIVGK